MELVESGHTVGGLDWQPANQPQNRQSPVDFMSGAGACKTFYASDAFGGLFYLRTSRLLGEEGFQISDLIFQKLAVGRASAR